MGKTISVIAGSNTMSATLFMPISGSIGQGNHSTESQAQIIIRAAGTWSDLQVNSTSGTPTILFRVNAVTKNQTITTGGQAHDSTHTDATVAGDKVSLDFSSGTSVVFQQLSSYFSATTDTHTRLNSTGDNSGITQSNENYFFVPGGRCATGGTSTEVNAQILQRAAGTMQHLYCRTNNNSRSETDTLNDRLNGANGSLTASIGSTVSGDFEDTTHITTIAVGDKYCIDIVLGSSTSSMSLNEYGIGFVSTAAATQMVDGISNGIALPAASTEELYIGGELQANSTESQRQATIEVAYTFSNISCNVITNTKACTLTYRHGGVSGNQTVTTTTGTGFFSDTTHIDVATVGDLINYQYATGSGATSTVVSFSMWGSTAIPVPLYLQPVFNEWIEI